jgi:hypothetical protein
VTVVRPPRLAALQQRGVDEKQREADG